MGGGIAHVLYHHVIRRRRVYGAVLIGILIGIYVLLIPPLGFPVNQIVEVERENSFYETTQMLEEKRIIHSALLFTALARITGTDDDIKAERYVFSRPMGVLEVWYRLAHGISGFTALQVTFYEGTTSYQMAEVMKNVAPTFDTERFLTLSESLEGRLFPDTYHFYSDVTPEEVIELLTTTFEEKFSEVRPLVEAYGVSEDEAIIMASLIEREAKTFEDKRIIAGILWKRIELDIALQVDAVFGYIHNRETYHPSFEDLEIDSPYNTYLYRGLPPGPISNPGLESLRAAVTPTESEYLYYLTGKDGVMYYAKTFEEHKENRARYLD